MTMREDEMVSNYERAQANEVGVRASDSRTSRMSEWNESALEQLRASLRSKSVPELLTPEQREALSRVVAALDDYARYFYPTDPRR